MNSFSTNPSIFFHPWLSITYVSCVFLLFHNLDLTIVVKFLWFFKELMEGSKNKFDKKATLKAISDFVSSVIYPYRCDKNQISSVVSNVAMLLNGKIIDKDSIQFLQTLRFLHENRITHFQI